ncbi:hypothetical protein B0H14DRAFT_3465682 [Mycena olivaceomarginata]|nr:hypothetical protein B0H14DRAFT_3465682 [Mycena olivaceomarginata]
MYPVSPRVSSLGLHQDSRFAFPPRCTTATPSSRLCSSAIPAFRYASRSRSRIWRAAAVAGVNELGTLIEETSSVCFVVLMKERMSDLALQRCLPDPSLVDRSYRGGHRYVTFPHSPPPFLLYPVSPHSPRSLPPLPPRHPHPFRLPSSMIPPPLSKRCSASAPYASPSSDVPLPSLVDALKRAKCWMRWSETSGPARGPVPVLVVSLRSPTHLLASPPFCDSACPPPMLSSPHSSPFLSRLPVHFSLHTRSLLQSGMVFASHNR